MICPNCNLYDHLDVSRIDMISYNEKGEMFVSFDVTCDKCNWTCYVEAKENRILAESNND